MQAFHNDLSLFDDHHRVLPPFSSTTTMSSAADAEPRTPSRASSSAIRLSMSTMSTDSTPYRKSKNAMTPLKSTLDPELIRDLENRFLKVDINDYVERILHTDMVTFNTRMSKDWSSVKEGLMSKIEAYISATQESGLYVPFIEMATEIIEKAGNVLEETLEFPHNLVYRNQSTVALKSDSSDTVKRLPDVVAVYSPPPQQDGIKTSGETGISNATGVESVVLHDAESKLNAGTSFSKSAKAKKDAKGISPKNATLNEVFLLVEFKRGIENRKFAEPNEFTPLASSSSRQSRVSKASLIQSELSSKGGNSRASSSRRTSYATIQSSEGTTNGT